MANKDNKKNDNGINLKDLADRKASSNMRNLIEGFTLKSNDKK